MPKGGQSDNYTEFDLAKWADAYGVEEGPKRAVKLAELFDTSSTYMREILRGNKKPGRIFKKLAVTLNHLAKVERELANARQDQADQVLAHLATNRDELALEPDELMALTRGCDK